MDIELIAMDLDGTALQADRKSFSPRLDAALCAAHERGVHIVPVTGRQFFFLPPAVHKDVEWAGLVVLSNGAEVRRLADGTLLAKHYLDGAGLLPLLSAAESLGLPVEISSNGGLYLTRESWEIQRHVGGSLRFHLDEILADFGHAVDDLGAFCRTADWVDKVNLPYIPDEVREKTERALNALPLSWFWSGPRSVEIAHPDASKAGGLLEVCKILGVDPARTMALGDSGNDIPMLRCAGLGVAMGNAPPEVRTAAREVTAPFDQDGAALAIEKFIL